MVFLTGSETVLDFYCLFISVLSLENLLSEEDFYCLFISVLSLENLLSEKEGWDLSVFQWFEVRGACLLEYWWNCWSSLFRLSFHDHTYEVSWTIQIKKGNMIENGHMCKHFDVWTSTRRNKGIKSHLTSSNNYDL